MARAYKGALDIYRDKARAGVEAVQDCLERFHKMHYHLRDAEFNTVLAQGLMAIGRVDEGMALIDETITGIEENGELLALPEALRVKGRLFLSMPRPNSDAAEECFTRSLELSRRQGARAWELRTASI